MSFRADIEEFFECENTNYYYEFKYNVELGVRSRLLQYLHISGKENTNSEYNRFLCSTIEKELYAGKRKYGEVEQEWGLLDHYYKQEVERATNEKPYNPYRLWVLLYFILQLKEE